MHGLAKPTLGFDSVKAAVVHLHGQGMGVDVIVHSTGSTSASVRTLLCKNGLRPHRQSTAARADQRFFIEIQRDLVQLLRPHAARRGLTVAALAALIIDTVAVEEIVDATLDDREDAR